MMSLIATLGFYLLGLVFVVFLFQPEPLRSIIAASVAIVGAIITKIVTVENVNPSRKAVIITGCDSGFGFDLAIRLDALGFIVFAGCLRPHHNGADRLKHRTSKSVHILKIDVTDDVQVRDALKHVTDQLKGHAHLWAVVNNAGIGACTEIEWCSVDLFKRVMDVNVFGVVRVTKAFLPLIRKSKGRIINIASLAGRFTLPAFSAYSMSKKACIAFSDGLRLEMAKFDVRVVTIEPGLYRTPITDSSVYLEMNRKSWEELPSQLKDDYGEAYFKSFLDDVTEKMDRARTNTNEVVDLMVEAVISTTPRTRYVPYWLADLRAHVLMSLPVLITDRLFSSSLRVDVEMKRRESMQAVETNEFPSS